MNTAAKGVRWNPRVRQDRVRRLYRDYRIGIHDEGLLLDVGWALYARASDVLTLRRAYQGEVPCPECGMAVARARPPAPPHEHQAEGTFRCPNCASALTWTACKDELRNAPMCFACLSPLIPSHAENTFGCACGKVWTWQQYRQSVKCRIWLPCPHCHTRIRRPASHPNPGVSEPPRDQEPELRCTRCYGAGVHTKGKFCCPSCGHEEVWRKYWRKRKRLVERLQCGACGHRFTWNAWRRQVLPADRYLGTGSPVPVEEFVAKWPACRTPGEQVLAIDFLLHALHGRGTMAPLFIDGDDRSVRALLDELATQC